MAPRPPYATDQPDSAYDPDPAPARRIQHQQPADPNKRTSAYDVYDNYLSAGGPGPHHNPAAARNSGIDALGAGLLAMDDDDSDDEDNPAAPPAASKHAALAAATSTNTTPLRLSPKLAPLPPQPIAAPRPGYAAPVSALQLPPSPSPQQAQPRLPQPIHLPPPGPRAAMPNPFADPARPPVAVSLPPPPSSPTAPHPLQPPITPITPVFARPAKLTFADPTKERTPRPPIIRSGNEDALLPSRGEKGDDFWRRFSMVAKQPEATKESSWLRKSQSRASRLSLWVWVVGMILFICIAGGIGIGWYLSHKAPAHQQPTVFGGNAGHTEAPASSTSRAAIVSGSSTLLKVTPTFTVANRALETPAAPIAAVTRHKSALKRRAFA